MSYGQIPWNAAYLDYPQDQHQTRMMVGDPKAMAWAWIYSYAQNLSRNGSDDEDDYYGSVSPEELIDTAMLNLEDDGEWPSHYISKGGLLESVSVDPIFWEKLAILKDLDSIPEQKKNNFFSCSC
jgi:hypothetical protein